MNRSTLSTTAALALLLLGAGAAHAAPVTTGSADPLVARGRYLVQVAGCNDCHTPSYPQNHGHVPEALWLTGDRLGWQGPWGTTYATNLRRSLATMSETQWLHYAREFRPRPPMPWFNLTPMADEDLRAIYRYVRALGPAGEPAPAFVPPGQSVSGPLVRFPAPPAAP